MKVKKEIVSLRTGEVVEVKECKASLLPNGKYLIEGDGEHTLDMEKREVSGGFPLGEWVKKGPRKYRYTIIEEEQKQEQKEEQQNKQQVQILVYEEENRPEARKEYPGRIWKRIRFYLNNSKDYVDLKKKVLVRGKQEIPLNAWQEGRRPLIINGQKNHPLAGKAYRYRYTLC